MRRLFLLALVVAAPMLVAQTQPAKNEPAKTAAGQKSPTNPPPKGADTTAAKSTASKSASPTAGLDAVLSAMDQAAAAFRSAETEFVWDQYEAVVQDHSQQGGVMYIRRNEKNIELAADITKPPAEQKYVLFTDGKVQLYQPKMDQVTVYNAGKNREAFQSFLVLGFGGAGHDLYKQFDVKYLGAENVQGVNAAKLELTPKSERVRGMFNPILLWIDPARGISVQQQFIEPGSGNYRLAKYTNIKINQKVPDTVFKIKTTGKTKFVTPNA